ncbi:NAD-glutamate dehydrogenase [Rhodococcus qingshengii]|uniref:NAD-glutamate dehydrogenase n=1 Tax=Rhodococcus TaxID=1827 RepID=UPI00067E730E|nr:MULTISPECIES: NAD-glutamate dehydrogenase [Rhodococcus]AUS32960.1 NAD-glutamate dehydrogenase [Rhodococcus qingshengii]MCC4304557.1 NAD-glutamate dehydrogenase [Rhodococcus sp. 3-2]MDI9943296.1 NAD-glutamate dehydrogenase [Rhodococcus sp. IEGM 1302]MEA1798259.1 NAD-glutamate dehydrogenase [Rhodococcus qingshengii]OMQ33137.1 NAD-glutamate dehydrogenase [Rhodococcus sp. D-1]
MTDRVRQQGTGLDEATLLTRLREAFFTHIDEGDSDDVINGRSDRVLLAHLALGRQRTPGTAVWRVYRPSGSEGLGAAVQIVTDDMSLLVESVTAMLNRQGVGISQFAHPILTVERDDSGNLMSLGDSGIQESWMHVQLDSEVEDSALDAIEAHLGKVLADVRQVVGDTPDMKALQLRVADELESAAETASGRITPEEFSDTARLLRWMADGNYAVLGYRRFEGTKDGSRTVAGSGLGVLRSDAVTEGPMSLPPVADLPDRPLLVLTQGSFPATVHRAVYPYFVGVSILDDEGNIVGEHRFLGVFTVVALHENVLAIPLIERRVREVIARAGVDLHSYSGQAMLEVIQSFPRTELFSSDAETLFETVHAVHSIGLRRQVRLFVREDTFGRFVSCLVYLPRDRYTTRVRLAMQNLLWREFGPGTVDYTARVTENDLALLHVTIRRDPDSEPVHLDVSEANRERVQALLTEVSRSWDDRINDLVRESPGVDPELVQRYSRVLPDGYKEDFEPSRALADIARLEALAPGAIDVLLYRVVDSAPGAWRFTLFVGGDGISLSQVLPVLQSLGVEVLDERPHVVQRLDGVQCWIYDFGLSVPADLRASVEIDLDAQVPLETSTAPLTEVQKRFTAAFGAVWFGRAEADRFNELVLRAGMSWRQAVVLRAYAKYLRQATFPYSQFHIEGIALTHPQTAFALVQLFEAMFDPEKQDDIRVAELDEQLRASIDEVLSLDADRILRGMFSLVKATLRTNFYVVDADGRSRDYLSVKLDPSRISELPKPRPAFEIYVYSPEVEGVHLRFGAVARGGLRWSDRREDFRTEVLGLVKAQAVKNAVIVPVGAKGGFVVKNPPLPTGDPAVDRMVTLETGKACYTTFISGLLDITDNVHAATGEVVTPDRVVRKDDQDRYLVVAADKGTATFSDLANSVAAKYDFWLGDAFASGGSVGYDHKGMGITARGAWESVKRHFRELGVDTQTQDFTTVGVGDMSGDVFGNGMLLSRHIRLVGAFDHRHIFLDPNPDAASSFVERQRLFELPRSSWADYDKSLISEGGGVWDRTVKSVPIAESVRIALGLAEGVTKLSPPELMQAILSAPVDLLWNGGIGTYVKASTETNAQVGDKSNDAVRVDGQDLRVKVIGEGGNLGVTALGRIEFSASGGHINTDAIDNSAGVDCSDHEVNIKILLDSLVRSQLLPTQERNPLLASMTDDVAALVLADNIAQNALLGISRVTASQMLGVHRRQLTDLTKARGLDRKLEALPTDKEIERRLEAGVGLTSPELATLTAHVKLSLKDDLLATELPDNDFFAQQIPQYFPTAVRDRFETEIKAHPLRRQIVATMLVNEVIDNGGITYAYRLAEETGASSTDSIRAYAAVREVFALDEVWSRIRSAGVSAEIENELIVESCRLLDRASRWFLANRPQPIAVGAEVARYSAAYRATAPLVPGLLAGHQLDDLLVRAQSVIDRGAPEALALDVFRLLDVYCLLDIADIADIADHDITEVAELYYALDAHLGIDWLLSAVSGLERGDRWHSLARLALRDDLYSSLRQLTMEVLAGGEPGESPQEKIDEWESTNASRLSRARAALVEIFESGTLDLATLSVAARQVRSMVRSMGTRSEVGR